MNKLIKKLEEIRDLQGKHLAALGVKRINQSQGLLLEKARELVGAIDEAINLAGQDSFEAEEVFETEEVSSDTEELVGENEGFKFEQFDEPVYDD